MKFFIPHCMRRALLLAAQDPKSGVVHQLLLALTVELYSSGGCAGVFSFTDIVKLIWQSLCSS